MKNAFTNPFASDFSMTSLEKVLKSGVDGKDTAENGIDGKNKRREVIVRGVLSVTVISADNLAPADVMGKADPYVALILKKTETKNKTRVLPSSLSLTPTPNNWFLAWLSFFPSPNQKVILFPHIFAWVISLISKVVFCLRL